MWLLRWFVSAMEYPDKDNYRRYRIRTVAGQDDFASMAEVVRRRYSRVLLEARESNPDTAEFSQEHPVEGLHRLRSDTRQPRTRPVCRRATSRPDHCRWRERATLFRLPRIAAAWAARIADHRFGERVRRNLPAGPRPSVATSAGFGRTAFACNAFATKRTASQMPITNC